MFSREEQDLVFFDPTIKKYQRINHWSTRAGSSSPYRTAAEFNASQLGKKNVSFLECRSINIF
jgi:hypothetical protein